MQEGNVISSYLYTGKGTIPSFNILGFSVGTPINAELRKTYVMPTLIGGTTVFDELLDKGDRIRSNEFLSTYKTAQSIAGIGLSAVIQYGLGKAIEAPSGFRSIGLYSKDVPTFKSVLFSLIS